MYISHRSGSKQPVVRLIALALCVCFIAVSLSSTAFVMTHLSHEHDHDGPGGSCATCAHLIAVVSLLKQTSAAVAGAAIAFGILSSVLSVLNPASARADLHTLVQLKVRLNN